MAFALGNDLLQDETVEAPKEKKKTIYQYLLKEKFFESLPISFNRAAYLQKARELNIPERTADKQIKSFCVKGMLVNVQHGKYEKG